MGDGITERGDVELAEKLGPIDVTDPMLYFVVRKKLKLLKL